MRDQNQCAHQRGSGARSTPHAASTPPSVSFFSLFSCPYKISQQSHQSGPTGARMNVLKGIIMLL